MFCFNILSTQLFISSWYVIRKHKLLYNQGFHSSQFHEFPRPVPVSCKIPFRKPNIAGISKSRKCNTSDNTYTHLTLKQRENSSAGAGQPKNHPLTGRNKRVVAK
jgi:hypothetical protein